MYCLSNKQKRGDSMSNPIVTVIVISYNESEYLQQAFQSILSQSYENIQIIIGDDGSDDGSILQIQAFAKEHNADYFVMERPTDTYEIIASLRVSNVIKKALSLAKGKYICILSGDDYFCNKEKIADAVAFLEDNPVKVAFVSGFKSVYADGRSKEYRSRFPMRLYFSGAYLHLSCFCFRREVYDKGLLFDRFCDDVGLMYSIGALGGWAYSDKITFVYRQRDKSIMHEAKQTELDIMELLLLQDCLCKGIFRLPAKARAYRPLNRLFKNRTNSLSQYRKFLRSSSLYPHDVVGFLDNYNEHTLLEKIKFYHFYTSSAIMYFYYKICRKLYSIIDN